MKRLAALLSWVVGGEDKIVSRAVGRLVAVGVIS